MASGSRIEDAPLSPRVAGAPRGDRPGSRPASGNAPPHEAGPGARQARLARGDLPPEVRTPPPGPRARRLSARLAASEAPGINTLPPVDAGEAGEADEAGAGAPASLLWEEALGANVLDVDGNRYLDFTSGFGVAAVGHRHPRVVSAVREQAGRLLHALGDVHGHPLRPELAERLLALAPVDDARVYFAVSGADAVEVALKTALLATSKPGVVAFAPAYHGLTLGALAATSRDAFRRPFAPWLHRELHRLPFGCPPERLDELLASRGDVGALVVEPVVGREGVLLPEPGWLAEVARSCREQGVVLVADEIFTGFGRTGHRFAVEAEGVRPDVLVCGKALGGGMPIGAAVLRGELARAWETGGEALHTATFVANPVACAAALAVLDVLESEDLPERAARLGARVAERLAGWPGRFPAVAETRGRGLLWGVELADRETAGRLVRALLARGVLALAGGPEGRVLQVVPPLTVPEPLLATGLDLVEDALGSLGRG